MVAALWPTYDVYIWPTPSKIRPSMQTCIVYEEAAPTSKSYAHSLEEATRLTAQLGTRERNVSALEIALQQLPSKTIFRVSNAVERSVLPRKFAHGALRLMQPIIEKVCAH